MSLLMRWPPPLATVLATATATIVIAAVAEADTFRVQIYDAPMRAKPNQMSRPVAKLPVNAEVEAAPLSPDGKLAPAGTTADWYYVSKVRLNPKVAPQPTGGYLFRTAIIAPDRRTGSGDIAVGGASPQVTAAVTGLDNVKPLLAGNPSYNYKAAEDFLRVSAAARKAANTDTFRKTGQVGEFGPWGAAEAKK